MFFIKSSSFRHLLYEQKGGYFLLPLAITLALSLVAMGLPMLEIHVPIITEWTHHTKWLVPNDPAMAQMLLAAIAGSCVTVVSVVYSVLLVALTFASMQFSPRIMTSFINDRISQTTLGLFIGTFAYCLILLPNVPALSKVVLPTLSLTFALVLATACLFYLIYFIHHMTIAIQVNYIVDHVARETENSLVSVFGPPFKGIPKEQTSLIEPTTGLKIISKRTGYIQYIDEKKLLAWAALADTSIYIYRNVGQFIPAGAACLNISAKSNIDEKTTQQLLNCIHVGALRSMESDVEFGIFQIVDIALKALSPAVNDPSTAICCIDHLTRILMLAVTLEQPICEITDQKGVIRIVSHQTSFLRLLNVSYNQIIPYGKNDMAVSLRLLRALLDIASQTNYQPYLVDIRKHAQRVVKTCASSFSPEDCTELLQRLNAIEQITHAQ